VDGIPVALPDRVTPSAYHLYGGAPCASVSLYVAVGEDYVVTSTAP
jgi:hypothetical protein